MITQNKIYKVKTTYTGNPITSEGTLEELIQYFSYTLKIGNSHNVAIKLNPRSIEALVNGLKKSYAIKECKCYEKTSVESII
jgi:hypothetical protein